MIIKLYLNKKGEIKMKNQNKVKETLNYITAFSKESYTKEEYLPELMKLQQEIVDITFNGEKSDEELRLWDVADRLKTMNKEYKGVADHELFMYLKKSKAVINSIKSEISGIRGENIVLAELRKLNCNNTILRNVELEFDGKRTEIDAIVFTHSAVFIIEVKNSKKNIFIDEYGDFYKNGDSMCRDGNIASKMNVREELLRKALNNIGLGHIKIFNIVVFTNPIIDVNNQYHRLKVCRSNNLAHFIDGFYSDNYYSNENIKTMVNAVEDAKCKEGYAMVVDMNEFKTDFANLIATLDYAKEQFIKGIEVQKEIKTKTLKHKTVREKSKSQSHIFPILKGITAASIGLCIALGFGGLYNGTR